MSDNKVNNEDHINLSEGDLRTIQDILGCWMGCQSISKNRRREYESSASEISNKIYEFLKGLE
jgi:hypothetical protein